MSPQDDRAARIAALKAQRAAQQSADTATSENNVSAAPPPPTQTPTGAPRRQPTARAARLITIGASSTAALGLMTAIGIAEQPVGASIDNTAANQPGTQAALPQEPGTLRVSADASVVMVVVDDTGRPIDLRQMSSVSELQQFLATAQPIVDVNSFDTSASQATSDSPTITTTPGAITATEEPTQPGSPVPTVARSDTSSAPATNAPVEVAQPASPVPADPTPATTAPPVAEPTEVAPAPTAPTPAEPATTAPPASAPATTAPPATTVPATTVPVAQPAPIVITLPSPTPPPAQGNTGGS